MKRFFAFGCSFTKYLWPTWADILGRQFDQYYNYGQSGAGNQFIFNSIIEANLTHNFSPNDTIAIMWTNVSREDRYINGQWLTPGNIFTQSVYDKKFLKNFTDQRGYYIRDLAVIWATNALLEKIKCQHMQFSMVDLVNPSQYENLDCSDKIQDLLNYYKTTLDKILPSMHNVVFNYDWQSRSSNTPIDLYTGIGHLPIKRATWTTWYNNIKDPSWPDCEFEEDFKNLPEHIQKECIEQFGYNSESHIKSNESCRDRIVHFYNKYTKKRKNRRDTHPTPKEHLEYLEKVLKNTEIKNDSKTWASTVDELLQNSKDYSKLWIPNTAKRW